MAERLSPLEPWLLGKDSLANFNRLDGLNPSQEFGCFVSFDVAHPAHEAHLIRAEDLETGWLNVQRYVAAALQVADLEEPGYLDREERWMIQEELGPPPPSIYPLYMMSVGEGAREEAVYVGITSSRRSRFRAGHAALTKLLDPALSSLRKTIYLGLVMLLDDHSGDYLPLEWVKPLTKAQLILRSVEAQLIYDLKPRFNRQGIKRLNASWHTPIMIENHSEASSFLSDATSYGTGTIVF